jgi:hypothetical protein
MSSMAALAFLAAAASVPPSSASAPQGAISADQAMAHYRSIVHDAEVGTQGDAACPESESRDIVVCGQDRHPAPRLPMPEARAEPGEVTHHLGEPPPSLAPSAPRLPSKQAQTIGKLFGLLREAVTGEDPDD